MQALPISFVEKTLIKKRGPPSPRLLREGGPFHEVTCIYLSRKKATLRFCQRSTRSLSGTT